MKKISHKVLESYFSERNDRAIEILKVFRKGNPDNNANVISSQKLNAFKEANDELLIKVLSDLNLLS